MLKCKKVAVTGGLSSGKTAVCHLFGQLNAYVVNADKVVHELLSLQTPIGNRVVALLGSVVVKNGALDSKVLDRNLIAQKVFKDPLLLKKLEAVLYPAVFERIEQHYQEALHLKSPLFIAEIPKLFEAKMESWFDVVITVAAEEDVCMERFESKGGTKDEYRQRMNNQMPIKEKIERSHYVIENNGDLSLLKSSVTNLFHVLTQEEFHPK